MNRLAMNTLRMTALVLGTLIVFACTDSPDHQYADEDAFDDFDEIMRIHNDGNEVDLVLTDGSLYMQLSEEKLDEIKEELDDERHDTEDSAFANSIKGMVLDSVEDMLHKKVQYPLEAVNSIAWDDGELIIDVEHEQFIGFDEIDTDDGAILETFDEDDAMAFIAAYEKAKSRL